MKALLENIKLGAQMLLIGAILLYIASTVFMPEMTIKIFGFQPFIVVTESMEPVFNVNDGVVATRFNLEEAQPGDIITFYADIDYNGTEEVVTHYIYSIEGEGEDTVIRTHRYFEEGETVTPDTWLLSPDDVIGSVSFGINYLGLIINFVKSIYGIAVISLNVIIFSVISFIHKRAERKLQEELEQEENHQSVPSKVTV